MKILVPIEKPVKVTTEMPVYGSTATIRPPENRHPPSPAERYPTSNISELSRSGFQPYRPEER